MHKRHGFTIVELLIVIVVIAILAAITIVAYSGIQQRSRNASRLEAIRSIQKGLELYKAANGFYPTTYGIGTNQPAGFTPRYGTGYSYSVATDDSWLKGLRLSGFVTQNIVDPINDNTHYFIYLSYGANGVGSCPEPLYVLVAYGWEGGTATMPPDARTLNCSISGVITAGWSVDNTQAVFSNLNHPVGT